MNAGSPHLDVDQLLACMNDDGAPDDRAHAHLAACPGCRTEQERWAAVAAGVRHLVAATPAPPALQHQPGLRHRPAPIHLPPAARPARRRRGAVVAVAAAAALVAGGTAYGLAAARGGSSSPRNATAGLTAVQGCPGEFAAAGNLEQVSGTQLTLENPSLQPVTVETSAATVISSTVTGTLSDITDGSQVEVAGTWSGQTLAATQVGIGVTPKTPHPPGSQPGHARPTQSSPTAAQPRPFVMGTVVHATNGSFTVVAKGLLYGFKVKGMPRRVKVVTSRSTEVLVNTRSSLSQLHTGAAFVAVGRIGHNGTLTAGSVAEEPMLQVALGGSLLKLRPSGCSASAITTALLQAGG